MIEKALKAAGYDCPPTEENLKECFLDYVAAGVFINLDLEEAEQLLEDGEITVKHMVVTLIKL